MGQLLQVTDRGLYCPAGDFYIDPRRSVERAVITHAHSDHARAGMRRYLCSTDSKDVLRLRVGPKAAIDTLEYGQALDLHGVRVSLHPAGHILGSAQIRVEKNGEVAVVSGDYKTEPDRTCASFEPIRCHTFVTESTFGLPIYRWAPEREVFAAANRWWADNQTQGRASVFLGYSLGKSQRVLSGLDDSIGPIVEHPALRPYTDAYRARGIQLPQTQDLHAIGQDFCWSKSAILAPPGLGGASWPADIGSFSTAYLSGWMAIGKMRRGRGADMGFVLSDHVDWPSLMDAITATGAETVFVTHGYTDVVVRHLCEQGLDGRVLPSGRGASARVEDGAE